MPPSLTPEELAAAAPEENDAGETEVSEHDRETKDQISIHQAVTVREPKVTTTAASDAAEAPVVHQAHHAGQLEIKETTLPSTASSVTHEAPSSAKPAPIVEEAKAAPKEEPKAAPKEEPKPVSVKPASVKPAPSEEVKAAPKREEPKPAPVAITRGDDIDDEAAFASRAMGEAVTLRVERGKLSEEPKPKVEVEAREEPVSTEKPASVKPSKVDKTDKTSKKSEPREEPRPAAKSTATSESSASHSSPSISSPSHSSKRRGESDEARPSSRKPSRDAADRSSPSHRSPSGELETDMSSVSAEFFRKDTDSLPPLIDSQEHHLEGGHDEEEALDPELTPHALARRARLRRVVAGVVAFAGVISLAVVGKSLAGSSRRSSQVTPPPTVAVEAKTNDAPKPVESAKLDKKPDEVKPADSAKAAESAKPADSAKAAESAKPADSAKPEDGKPASPDSSAKPDAPKPSGGDATALRKEAEKLLNQGRNKDAVEKAREAIAADPSEAMGYLLHGSALQAMGKWKDGVDSYSECVRTATKGPVHECRAMGGRK